jgi:hypothetical protein
MMAVCFAPPIAYAELPASTQAKADAGKKKLVEWAANADIVAVVKEANPKNGLPGMSNGKWDEVGDKDPMVLALSSGKAGALLKKWETENKTFNKLVLRDVNSFVIAATVKPLVYKNAARPVFINAMKGQAWTESEIKPDPTTQVKSVQASAPVLDGGKVIGVLHAGISVE